MKGGNMQVLRLAAVVGLVAAGALVPGVCAGGEGAKEAPKKTVQVVEVVLQGEIAEQRAVESPFGPSGHVLREYTASIRKAAKDDDVRAILLRLNYPSLGLAKRQELLDAIGEFKAAKKKVYCYLEACGNGDYLVACSADKVCAPPGGMILLTGLAAQVTFFKGTLDWAGIQAEMLHFGKHKAAAEPFTRDSLSEENRQVLNELLDDLYAQFVATIAKGRGLSADEVKGKIDHGPYGAHEARIHHLIDDVAYFDQFLDSIGQELGGKVDLVRDYHHLGPKGPDLSELNLFSFFAALKPKPDIPENDRPKVAIVYATGMIVFGQPSWLSGSVVTAQEIQKAFQKAREAPTVKAVVLRVDSPGGSALVSDLIWREVERTRKAGKPVVASMSDVAASGGYYISMGADAIVAQPATTTGSIGVVGGKLVLRGLYGKLGITKEILARGKNATLFSEYTPFSDDERKRVEALMKGIYDDFVHKAALGRSPKLSHDDMEKLATGRVWTGREAQKLKLVDALGGLKEAFDLAVEKAGLKGQDVQPVVLPREKSFLEALFSPSVQAPQLLGGLPLPEPVLRTLPCMQVLDALSREQALTVMPYLVEIR